MKKPENKGITLIALVITIIVLLILAGVSIAMLTGENGLLTKAGDAKENSKMSAAYEQLDLVKTEWYMEEKLNENADLETYLQGKEESGEIDSFQDNNDGTYTIIKEGYERTIEDSNAEYCTITKVYENKTETQRVRKGQNQATVTYDEKEGYYFAGWSNDPESFTRTNSFKGEVNGDMILYPKYISENDYLLATRMQLFIDTGTGNIDWVNLYSNLDSSLYRSMGFDISVNGGEPIEKRGHTTQSSSVTNSSTNEVETVTSMSLFNKEGLLLEYIISEDEIDYSVNSEITITPYYYTFDYFKVRGTPKTVIYTGQNFVAP